MLPSFLPWGGHAARARQGSVAVYSSCSSDIPFLPGSREGPVPARPMVQPRALGASVPSSVLGLGGRVLSGVGGCAGSWLGSILPSSFQLLGPDRVREHRSPLARCDDGTQTAPAGWDWSLLDAGHGVQLTRVRGPRGPALLQRPQYSILSPRGQETSRQGLD